MSTKVQEAVNPDVEKIGALIKGIEVAMMVTVENDGSLRARPMMTQQVEFDGSLWFFSGEYSGKNAEIRKNNEVQISYVDVAKNRYVSLSGAANVVRERAKLEELWTPAAKAWFPGGIDDPNLSLIRVDVTHGEYWDGPSKTMVKLRALGKMLKGENYQGEGGDHRKVSL